MKDLQHISKKSEIFELYTCNIHRILMQPPLLSALGRQHAATVAGDEARASTPGPSSSPCTDGACQRRRAGWARRTRAGVEAGAVGRACGTSARAAGRTTGAMEVTNAGGLLGWYPGPGLLATLILEIITQISIILGKNSHSLL